MGFVLTFTLLLALPLVISLTSPVKNVSLELLNAAPCSLTTTGWKSTVGLPELFLWKTTTCCYCRKQHWWEGSVSLNVVKSRWASLLVPLPSHIVNWLENKRHLWQVVNIRQIQPLCCDTGLHECWSGLGLSQQGRLVSRTWIRFNQLSVAGVQWGGAVKCERTWGPADLLHSGWADVRCLSRTKIKLEKRCAPLCRSLYGKRYKVVCIVKWVAFR